jgi:hypothetical protein
MVVWRGRVETRIAHEAVSPERERLWRRAMDVYPTFDRYQERAGGPNSRDGADPCGRQAAAADAGRAAERTTGAGPKQPARLAPALIWLFVSIGHERVLLRVIGVLGVHDRSLPSPRRPRRARRLDSADIRGLGTACLDSVVGLPHTRLEHQDPGIRGS